MTNKEVVQKRVLYKGKPLDMDKFNWCEKTRTFSSMQSGLVIDFSGISHCTFKTGSECTFKTGSECTFNTFANCTFDTGSNCTFATGYYCTFRTGSYCTFKTGSRCTFDTGPRCMFDTFSNCTFKTSSYCTFRAGYYCTFDTGSRCIFRTGSYCTFNTFANCTFDTGSRCTFRTGSYCTFDTGSNCTFDTGSECKFKTGSECVIARRDIFEVIQPKENQIIQLCPSILKGHLADGYLNGDESMGKHIVADGILSKILSKRGNVYKVINHDEEQHSFLIESNGVYSHGKTLKKAKESLVYKVSNRDTSMYEDYTLETKITKDEAIVMYMTITGACAYGTKHFVDSIEDIPSELTVKEVIELTNGQYGNEEFIRFIKKENKDEN